MAKRIKYKDLYTLRKDGRYQAAYTDATGNRCYLYDRDPERLYHKVQQFTDPAEQSDPTFREIASDWEREHRETITERTWANYVPHYNDIVNTHGKKHIDDITALDINQDLMSAKAKGYSATVVNTRRSIYCMIFDYAIAHGYTRFNPVSAVSLPKGLKRGKRSAPTDEQIQVILQSIDAPFGLFPFFLLCTGLRKSEALALQWSDVDLKNNQISITKSLEYGTRSKPTFKSPKTEAGNRTVPIISILHDPLKKRMGKPNDYLFPAGKSNRAGPGGGVMGQRSYEGAWRRYCEYTGLVGSSGKPAITAHQLRHGTATLMFESGVDELTCQHILGHSRIEITREIYTDLRAAQEKKSIRRLDVKMSKLMSKSKKQLK